jgi:hypothetical protein
VETSDIIRIVELIESTKSETLKRILTDYLAGALARSNIIQPDNSWSRGCKVCGIGSDGKPMGYVCSRTDCPTRITCL